MREASITDCQASSSSVMSSAGMIVESNKRRERLLKRGRARYRRRRIDGAHPGRGPREQHPVEAAAEEAEIDVAQRIDDVLQRR